MTGGMEHRCGDRHPLRMAVLLRAGGCNPVAGITREISISGMFVEVPAQFFRDHGVVELEASVPPSTGGLRVYRWRALVVRRTGAGLGLMFNQLRPPAIARILAIAATEFPGLPPPVAPARPADPPMPTPH
ncbi:MAG: PilZ domain-containing protein [Gammaproteobacteria bacterium]|nr:PilZ domain-containing protein [Gammaproteobacteria bacterium]